MYLTYPSARDMQISQSDSSVVSILNKVPEFLGAKVGVALTALGAGMSFMDPSFLIQLNALNLPLQLQLAQKKLKKKLMKPKNKMLKMSKKTMIRPKKTMMRLRKPMKQL